MNFLRRLFKGNEVPGLVQALAYQGKSRGFDQGVDFGGGDTWSNRRDAAARLGGLGDRDAVGPLRDSLEAAIQRMNAVLTILTPTEVSCLLRWPLTVLPESHTKEELRSLSERTGTALSIIRICEFEWAWATAIVHAEALARLGDADAPQQLLSELQKREGTQWKEAESIFGRAGVL